MKVIGFNGSPRKKWNTAMLVKSALDGAASVGAETESVNLYDLNFRGCVSCFACKRLGAKSYGRCGQQDGLTPYLDKIETADAIVFGAPVYLGAASSGARAFIERLVFGYYTYTDPPKSLFPGKTRVGQIYTFGATEAIAVQRGWDKSVSEPGAFIARIIGPVETLLVYDTYQFDDYSKYEASRFDPAQKASRRRDVFPQERQKAFDMGVRLVQPGGV